MEELVTSDHMKTEPKQSNLQVRTDKRPEKKNRYKLLPLDGTVGQLKTEKALPQENVNTCTHSCLRN